MNFVQNSYQNSLKMDKAEILIIMSMTKEYMNEMALPDRYSE